MKVVVALLVLLSVALQATATCPSGQYECDDDSIFYEYCVSDNALCDGTEQCPRGDDEDNCPYCYSYQWECDSGVQCIDEDYRCDGDEDCYDGSDENGCATINVRLAVGLAIGGFVLFIVAPFIVCIVIVCCCVGVCSTAGGRGRTTVVTHAAPAAAPNTTVVTSNNSNMMQQGYNPVPAMPMNPPPYRVKPDHYQPGPSGYPM